jgi:hypothetical protein
MAGKKQSQKTSASLEVRAVVDRIEDGEIAVLSLDDEAQTQLDIPLKQLPKDANSDGDHLILTFDVTEGKDDERTIKSIKAAPAARASAEERIKKMQERLARMSGAEDKKDFKL